MSRRKHHRGSGFPKNHSESVSDADNIAQLTPLRSAWTEASSSQSTVAASRPLCRFYFLQHNCRFGDSCSFSHQLPEGVEDATEARRFIPCPYFAHGNCRYGDYCELRHDPQDLPDTKNASTSAPSSEEETAIVCGICLENVAESGRKYGLLSGCQHSFCFECLMEWRKEGSSEAQDRRKCPTCREKSSYVVPSSVWASTTEEKERIVHEYHERLSGIPCKRFDGRLGSCEFGSDCFYLHLDDDGNNVKALDKTTQELYEERRRKSNQRRRSSSLQREIDMITRMLLLDMYMYREELGLLDSDSDEEGYLSDLFD